MWVEKYAASNIDKPYSFLWVTLHLFLATSILLFALALKLVFTDKVILFYVILVTSFFHDVNAMNFVLCYVMYDLMQTLLSCVSSISS